MNNVPTYVPTVLCLAGLGLFIWGAVARSRGLMIAGYVTTSVGWASAPQVA